MNTIERIPQRIQAWLNQRGISNQILEEYKIGWDGHRIVIPVYDQDHCILFNKYRRDPEGDYSSNQAPKYSYDKGSTSALFGIESLNNTRDVVICEGELDCLLLLSHDIAAVSSTGGCGTFQDDWTGHFIDKNVYIVFDNDEPGMKGAFNVQQKIPHAQIAWLPREVGVGGDITDFLKPFHYNDSKMNLFSHFLTTAKNYRIPKPMYRDPETKQELKHVIQENNKYASDLLNQKSELVSNNLPYQYLNILLDYVTSVIDADKRRLKYMGVKVKDSTGFAEKIREAKRIPIDNFIQFDRTDTTKCIWHDEKTGSMHYYKNQNRVKCFGCGQMGDTIDVIMQIYDTDMKGALKIILNN